MFSSLEKIPGGDDRFYTFYPESRLNTCLLMLLVMGLLYFIYVIFYEFWLPSSPHEVGTIDPNEDQDIKNERLKVENLINQNKCSDEALVCQDLTKFYELIRAVNKITFTVQIKEFFGLLGVNGAGKTTTFQLLAGDVSPSDGRAFCGPFSLKDNRLKYLRRIGFCPQTNPLIDGLTGTELLYLFARLRGIKQEYLKDEVNKVIEAVDIIEITDRLVVNYSVGNKRKICLGMALIGNPQGEY